VFASLTGKVAIVTGAGRNIGEAIAGEFAAAGARIAVVDRDRQLAEAVCKQLRASSGPHVAMPVVCDVTDEDAVKEMVTEVVESLGRVDVLVNNVASSDRGRTVLDLELSTWTDIFDVCVTSTFLCSKWVAKQMVESGSGGAVVNIGSTSGYLGRRNALAYPMAKSALLGLTRSMAIQLGPHGIRVNLVAPNKAGSPVGESELNPSRQIDNLVGRPADPADIARAVRYLASDDASFITGVDLLVDGGAVLTAR
jgi:NAD(P)-dependent dehydrogenase (short-subunit alcohol dehydrogenase family)